MTPRPLTPRELACLSASAAGLTSRAIACQFGLSERTVNFHLHNACAKLQVRGRRAAATAALARGLLSVPAAAAAIAGTRRPALAETAPKAR